jgi:hypothetical protein
MIPIGKYRANVVACSYGVSATKGTPYVQLVFGIIDDAGLEGERVDWFGWLSQPADSSDEQAAKCQAQAERVAKSLVTCGYGGDDPEEFASGDVAMVPSVVSIDVQHEEFNGKTRPRVAWINPVGQALPDEKAAALKAAMKSAFGAARAEAGVPSRPTQRQVPAAAPAAAADNIPF